MKDNRELRIAMFPPSRPAIQYEQRRQDLQWVAHSLVSLIALMFVYCKYELVFDINEVKYGPS
jgi:hypothetical protein